MIKQKKNSMFVQNRDSRRSAALSPEVMKNSPSLQFINTTDSPMYVVKEL